MRREVVLLGAMILAFGLHAEETELKFYRPYVETPRDIGPAITERKFGECLAQSNIIKREDAWRCAANGETFDPCYVKKFGPHFDVMCVETPWADRKVLITVAKSLNSVNYESLDMSQTFPWAVELVSGEKCRAVEYGQFYDELPVRYLCGGNQKLLGHVQRCDNQWKMLRVTNKVVDTVPLKRAWF